VRQSGEEWTDPEAPCLHFKCVAGIVTESTKECYTPCNHPLAALEDQCCQSCYGEFSIKRDTQRRKLSLLIFCSACVFGRKGRGGHGRMKAAKEEFIDNFLINNNLFGWSSFCFAATAMVVRSTRSYFLLSHTLPSYFTQISAVLMI
jgi:hypothetical protein